MLQLLIDLLVPPRPTERSVRALSLEDLYNLQTEDGLPYHEPVVRGLVWELKYYASKRAARLAGALLCEELLALAADELGKPLLIPVPMHASRKRERGHNQTELMCEAALKALGKKVFDYAPNLLIRTINTRTQQGLARAKRLKNVHRSMSVIEPNRVAGRVCVVVDDVSTTGATLQEASRVLCKAGARRVHTVTLARS